MRQGTPVRKLLLSAFLCGAIRQEVRRMNILSGGPEPGFDFSPALGIALRAHNSSLAVLGGDVFSLLRLDRSSVGSELPPIASTPAAAPSYTAVPYWKPWRDF
jgi:hypothetical protein